MLDEGIVDFFHLSSVQEFLEELPAYSAPSFKTLAAEYRLVCLASRSQTLSVRRYLSDHYSFKDDGKKSMRSSIYSHAFNAYAAHCVMVHYSAAETARANSPLQLILQVFLLGGGGKISLSLSLSLQLVDYINARWNNSRIPSADPQFWIGYLLYSRPVFHHGMCIWASRNHRSVSIVVAIQLYLAARFRTGKNRLSAIF